MLKTLEGSSAGTIIAAYFRRFGGWVTGLKNKYLSDPFFHSEFNVISLQILFAASLILLVAFYFNYLYEDVTGAIVSGIIQGVETNNPASGEAIIEAAELAKRNHLIAFIIIAVLFTAAFSYIIARVTLTPVRNTLKNQKRFISDIAHELRTPLSVIKTNTEVTLIDSTLSPKMKNMLKSNIEELDRTSEIINNLLSFNSMLRPGRMNFAHVDLGKVVDEALKKMKNLAVEKKIELSVKKVGPYTVWGNTTALEQITMNLLKNSITYTPPGGHVDVKIEPDYNGNVLLTIRDSGIGISRHDLVHIFEPFYRAERSRNRRAGSSSGLGLTIVSELVKLHSGRITIKSSLNRGTTVVICLPFSKMPDSGSADPSPMTVPDDEIALDFLKK